MKKSCLRTIIRVIYLLYIVMKQQENKMIKNNNKPYIVYSYKLMKHLSTLGFTPFATSQNMKFPDKLVFIYSNTNELLEAIENYLSNK